MIKAVIIDDEAHCISRLRRLIEGYCSADVAVADVATNVDDGIEIIRSISPDLVFLDVQIGSETAFDLIERMPLPDINVVFTTAFEKYAVDAFRVNAVDYLLKPVDPDDLVRTVSKILSPNPRPSFKNIEQMFRQFVQPSPRVPRIAVSTSSEVLLIDINDIIRCKSDINYTTLFLLGNKTLVVAKTLKEFEQQLAPHNFFRIHNSHLINLQYVSRYIKGKGGYVQLQDQSYIEVSSRRKEDFLKKLVTL